MPAAVRPYRPESDYPVVGDFLLDCFVPGEVLHAWLQPRWEYMFGHPNVDQIDLRAIGLATDGEQVVGAIHPEHAPAFSYLQYRPDRADVIPLLVRWAEEHLGGWSESLGRHTLGIYAHDETVGAALRDHGFVEEDHREDHAVLDLTEPPPEPSPPTGYRIQSLADDNDLHEVNRVLWRGFDHQGPPPVEYVPSRLRAQQTPNYSHDMNIVAVGPDDHFVAYAGVWHEPTHQIAYVEPVATDPEHRRRGLGSAVVLECLRRARAFGATKAWVGSDQEFYASLGFRVACASQLWTKEPARALATS